MRKSRTRPPLLALLGSLVASAVLTTAAGAAPRVSSATYEGTFRLSTHLVGQNVSGDDVLTATFTMKIYDSFPNGTPQRSMVAQGSYSSVNSEAGASNDKSCQYKAPADASSLPITLGLGDSEDTLDVTAAIANLALTGGTGNCPPSLGINNAMPDGSYAVGACASFPPTTAFEPLQKLHDAPVDGYTRAIDLDQNATSYPCTNQTATASRSIHAKLIVGSGGPAAPTPDKALAARERQKAFATSDLLTQLLRAEGPCGYVALGATTALWSATVGGPTAPAALLPAAFLISAGTPLCTAYLIQAVKDINIIHDPPVGDINRIAKPAKTPSSAAAAKKLPSCASQPAELQTPCAALRAALADQIAAAQRSASIAEALLSTVDRETKAHKTHHATALKRQSAAGDALVARLKATERSERAAGAKVAKIIGDLGVTGQLTAEQDGTAIAAIVSRLKAKAVSRATLQQLAPSALTAAPYDLLGHMG